MIVIDDKIISDDVVEKQFVCNLSACKGACCVEGDSGAPLELDEMTLLEENYEKFKPYLTKVGIAKIEARGHYELDEEDGVFKTPLVENKACAYINYDEKGTAICGIEKAYLNGESSFKKPVSCHLYPIRITKHKTYDAVNYEQWDICNDACTLGKSLQVPVYKFVKDALIRKYGEDFYNALDATAKELNKDS